eukprot:973758-Amphidinium_carterae.1
MLQRLAEGRLIVKQLLEKNVCVAITQCQKNAYDMCPCPCHSDLLLQPGFGLHAWLLGVSAIIRGAGALKGLHSHICSCVSQCASPRSGICAILAE